MGEREDDGEKLFDDLRRWQVPEDEIAKLKAEHRRDARSSNIEVEPENRAAVRIFTRAMSQWRGHPVATAKHLLVVRTGLDYAALPVIAQATGHPLDEETLDKVRVMESIALAIYAERQTRILQRG
jgi:hypothetical protein